jgi:hypothetical protein
MRRDFPEGVEFVSKPEKGSRHSKRSEESELKTRLFATLRVTIKTFYTVSMPSARGVSKPRNIIPINSHTPACRRAGLQSTLERGRLILISKIYSWCHIFILPLHIHPAGIRSLDLQIIHLEFYIFWLRIFRLAIQIWFLQWCTL